MRVSSDVALAKNRHDHISSGIALESFASLCADGVCDTVIAAQTDTDQDGPAATLDPLLASVNASIQNASGTVSRPITLGQTHTLRIKPNLNGVGGTGCGPPPGWFWSCSRSSSWSFDVAPPVPSPTASSWRGLLLLLAGALGSGGFALRNRA